MTSRATAALPGWYTLEEPAALLGSRCLTCGSYFFPRLSTFCRNPHCEGSQFEELRLSRSGRIWSFTNACYPPPPPYLAPEPFVPFAIAAVELERERLIVLGQVVSGVDVAQLAVGMAVELVLETLFRDADGDRVVWKWRPCAP